jgi:hypothetical protein
MGGARDRVRSGRRRFDLRWASALSVLFLTLLAGAASAGAAAAPPVYALHRPMPTLNASSYPFTYIANRSAPCRSAASVTHLRGLNLTNGRFREELNASTDPSSSCQTTDASAGVDLDLVTPTFIASAGGAAVVRAHLGIRLALDLSSTCHGVPPGGTQAAGSFYLNLFLYDLTANRHWAASPAYANTSYVTPNATLVVQRSYNL